jgi:hypothetical protein
MPRTVLPILVSLALTGLVGAVVAGTLQPWPVAVAKLSSVGPGPYVPLTYKHRTSGTGETLFRRQTYFVVSRLGESFSFYRVVEENGVARIEEAPDGMLYGVAYALVMFGSAWAMSRRNNGVADA